MRFLVIILCLIQLRDSFAGLPHPHGVDEILVKINRTQEFAKFEANKDLIETIFLHPQVADRKIVVFSIIGAYRDGKSFFLDYCLRYLYATYGSINTIETKVANENWFGGPDEPLSGFSWKHGSTAHTKGIMMWSDVFLFDAPSGAKLAIFIIDTQGLFEPLSTEEENAKIFSFSTLISSIQIINIKEKIQENQIQHLRTALELTNLIQSKKRSHHARTKKAFQNLIFLMRDFEDEEYGYGFEGGQRYFDKFFGTNSSQKTIASVNRNSIRESFDKIFCFLLGHPGSQIKKSTFNGQWGVLDIAFTSNLKIVIENLLSPDNLVKKSVLGSEMTSRQFKDYFLALTKSYSDFQTPEINSLFQVAVDNQMSAIVKEMVIKYKEEFNQEPIDYDKKNFTEWLEEMHQNAKNKAVSEFLSADKIEDEVSEGKFRKVLEHEIDASFESIRRPIIDAYWLAVENKLNRLAKEQVNIYKSLMDAQAKDFKQKEFARWLQRKHEEIKNQTVKEFLEENFDLMRDGLSKERHKINLENDIEESSKSVCKTTIEEYKFAVKNQLSLLVKKHLISYKNSMTVQESDLRQKNFSKWLQEKHEKAKKLSVDEFLKVKKIGDRESEENYKTNLELEIEESFKFIKASTLQSYWITVDKELNSLVRRYVNNYEISMNFLNDYNQQNFELKLYQEHERIKSRTVDEFTRADKIGNELSEEKYKKILAETIEEKFKSIKRVKMENFKNAREKFKINLENQILSRGCKS